MTSNPYHILSITPTAEDIVIRAAYKALTQINNPKIKEPDQEKKRLEIEKAYKILSDPKKREIIDNEIKKSKQLFFYGENIKTERSLNDFLEEKWTTARNFHPKINNEYLYLCGISDSLGNVFRIKLLEEKNFTEYAKTSYNIRNIFLESLFGKVQANKNYGEKLLLAKEYSATSKFMYYLETLGYSVLTPIIVEKLNNDFPKLSIRERNCNLYFNLLRSPNSYHNLYLFISHHDSLEIIPPPLTMKNILYHIWHFTDPEYNNKLSLIINNEKFSFSSYQKASLFLLEKYKENYI